MEIILVVELPTSHDYSYELKTCDAFSQYSFAVPLRKPDTTSVVHALLQIYAQHAYLYKHILGDEGTAFTSQP